MEYRYINGSEKLYAIGYGKSTKEYVYAISTLVDKFFTNPSQLEVACSAYPAIAEVGTMKATVRLLDTEAAAAHRRNWAAALKAEEAVKKQPLPFFTEPITVKQPKKKKFKLRHQAPEPLMLAPVQHMSSSAGKVILPYVEPPKDYEKLVPSWPKQPLAALFKERTNVQK